MDIQANNLPRPSAVAVQMLQVRRQTPAGNLLMTRVPDTQLAPRRFTLSWREAYGAVGDAIRRHYREHPFETFTFKLPRTGEVVFVRWAAAPSISWTSAASASITAELDEMLAHE
jgi:hypothetical protein